MPGITLSTGKVVDAAFGIIGINEQGEVFEGYDGHIFSPTDAEFLDVDPLLSTVERIELAEVMIARWSKFKADAESEQKDGLP